MIKLKGLKKKILRLEASMQKDGRKLAKLKRKVESALRAGATAGASSRARADGATKSASPAMPAGKKKRNLTPEGREKLSALMKARWEVKRAAAAHSAAPVGGMPAAETHSWQT